jgi:hypothetical protein
MAKAADPVTGQSGSLGVRCYGGGRATVPRKYICMHAPVTALAEIGKVERPQGFIKHRTSLLRLTGLPIFCGQSSTA